MAYILGFIFADGNIILTKRGTWFWSIQITDKEILEKIRTEIGSSHKISKKRKIDRHKELYRLQIGSKEMCGDLQKLGLTQRKSNIMNFPQIPSLYVLDFIRGYFDGDGGVWVGVKNKKHEKKKPIISTYFTSGSINFLSELRKILMKYGIVGGSLIKKERGFELKYSIKNSLILHKIMYNGRYLLFLARKKRKFEKYINIMRS